MKIKALYVVVGLLTLSTSLLATFIIVSKYFVSDICFVCEDRYFGNSTGDNTQLWGTTDAIPDKETARKIADIIIERQVLDKDNYVFVKDNVEITFDKQKNEWLLYYGSGWTFGGDVTICLRRNNGAVTYLMFGK